MLIGNLHFRCQSKHDSGRRSRQTEFGCFHVETRREEFWTLKRPKKTYIRSRRIFKMAKKKFTLIPEPEPETTTRPDES
ncbi:MAG: hypothetical protein AUJ19_04175 [Parcubacteria group bacterium CG1_02_58_44]|nr:MAG: hypothetical protein AUJ19_04175 [Parcubacteria group bacterium CG1_02_58_44]